MPSLAAPLCAFLRTLALAAAAAGIAVAQQPQYPTAGEPTPQQPSFPPHLVGNASAVYALLERVLPGSSAHFTLSLARACPGVPSGTNCFTLADGAGGKTEITGTTRFPRTPPPNLDFQ